MKSLLLAFSLLAATYSMAQSDTVVSGVHHAGAANRAVGGGIVVKPVLQGSTRDLTRLDIRLLTIPAGGSHEFDGGANEPEKLLIIQSGTMSLLIHDTSRSLGSGGSAVILPGDACKLGNATAEPLSFFVLSYQSKMPPQTARGKQAGGSFAIDWKDLEVKTTARGESRPVFDRPTSMFTRFDMHATALNPGMASHDPHTHRSEEIILMMKGGVEMQVGERFEKAVAGDVVFLGSGVLHACKNKGQEQCGYFAIQWRN